MVSSLPTLGECILRVATDGSGPLHTLKMEDALQVSCFRHLEWRAAGLSAQPSNPSSKGVPMKHLLPNCHYDTMYQYDSQIIIMVIHKCNCERSSRIGNANTNKLFPLVVPILALDFTKDAYLSIFKLATNKPLTVSELTDFGFVGLITLLSMAPIIQPRVSAFLTKLPRSFRSLVSFWRRG